MSETSQYNLDKPAAELVAFSPKGPRFTSCRWPTCERQSTARKRVLRCPMLRRLGSPCRGIGDVRVLVITPRGAEAQLPVVLYMHGGGWILGSALSHGRLAGELSVAADAAVAFIDYSLAPEARYPVQIEQCYAVARWVTEQGESHGLDPSRIAVAGDSAGGNMATVLCIMAKRRGDLNFVQQSMYYPMTDALTNEDSDSYRLFKDGPYGTPRRWSGSGAHTFRSRTCVSRDGLPAAGNARRAQRPAAGFDHRRRERHSPRPRRGVRIQATRRRCANSVRAFQRHDARLHESERVAGHRNDARSDEPGRFDVPARVRHGGVKNSGYGKFGGTAGIESFTEQRWITVLHARRPTYPF